MVHSYSWTWYIWYIKSDKKWYIKSQKDLEELPMHIPKGKKDSLKRLYTMWFQIFGILEKAKL